MIRRTLVLLGSALLALLLFAPAASAQYPSDDSISVDNPNPDVGDTIVVSGDCFPPGSTVTLRVVTPWCWARPPRMRTVTTRSPW
jgi:hypothetical protein